MSQVLVIDPPNEITFKGPFTDVVVSHLKLTNPSDKSVCFKVKTTAPKQYCVRPNSGVIPPNESVLVSIMLQPFDYVADERNKHKFMVQTAFMPDGEHSLDNVWKVTGSQEMMDSKLRVIFDVSADQMFSVEKPTKTQFVQQQQASQPTNNTATNVTKPTNQSFEADYRRIVDENKRYLHQVTQIEQENIQLRNVRESKNDDRLKKLELGADGHSTVGGAGSTLSGQSGLERYTMMHLILVFIVALFVGKEASTKLFKQHCILDKKFAIIQPKKAYNLIIEQKPLEYKK
uniref:Major sperm protein n=1 Tax=Romanomermis culicivorax TaxID=13658 RepID=A0A915J5J9_ROMCU